MMVRATAAAAAAATTTIIQKYRISLTLLLPLLSCTATDDVKGEWINSKSRYGAIVAAATTPAITMRIQAAATTAIQ